MQEVVTDEDVQKALDFLRANSFKAAKARADRLYLERYEKHLVAIVMKEKAMSHNGPGKMSLAEQEREAYADEQYLTHIKGYQAAVETDEKQRFGMLSAQSVIDAWRSQQANNRAMEKLV